MFSAQGLGKASARQGFEANVHNLNIVTKILSWNDEAFQARAGTDLLPAEGRNHQPCSDD
jgi:hypothetical protein